MQQYFIAGNQFQNHMKAKFDVDRYSASTAVNLTANSRIAQKRGEKLIQKAN